MASVLSILLGVLWVFELFKVGYVKRGLKDKFWMGFILLYVFLVFGYFISDNKIVALRDLEIKLSLLLYPIIIATSKIIQKNIVKHFELLLSSYLLGVFFLCLTNLFAGGYKFYISGNSQYLTYSGLALTMHSSYFSLYLNFAIAIVFRKIYNSTGSWMINILLLVLFLSMVILLGSKAGILSLGILLAVFVYLMFFKLKNIKVGLIMLVFMIGSCLIIINNKAIKSRMTEMISSVVNDSDSDNTSTSLRISVWRVGLNLIADKPLFGHGTGDVRDVLAETYKTKGLEQALKKKSNPHNQYLQTTIASGLLALIVLLYLLFVPLIFIHLKNMLLWGAFIVLVAFNLLFESMLERQAGVMFFVLFSCLFYVRNVVYAKTKIIKY